MFDVGSYRSAVDVLEGGSDTYPRPAPRSGLKPPSYESATNRMYSRKSRRDHRSQEELDGDWLSVPIKGESRSLRLGGEWNSVPNVSMNHSSYRVSSRDVEDDDDDGVGPSQNGSRLVSMGYRQQNNNHRNRRIHDVEPVRVNGSRARYDDSYSDDRHMTTGRSVYMDDRRGQRSHSRNGNSFTPASEWDNTSTRLIFNGQQSGRGQGRSYETSTRAAPQEKKFLNEVQKELEFQRQNWKDEIERMTGSLTTNSSSSSMATKSSYVDTSGGEPRFKAFIDVSEFPSSSVSVNVDKISNKIIVEAKQTSGIGSVAKTFTQKVQLPRFADDTRLSARMNRDGILKVEVPLIYYFPEEEQSGQKMKSFVYEVRENGDGSKTMEILVRPGKDFSIEDIRVGLSGDNKLVVFAERPNDSQRTIIKKYTLPENADVQNIASNPTDDGGLTILVPINEKLYR